MSGMTTTLNSTNVSDHNSRIVLVEVAGVFSSNVMRKKPYTIKVPVSRLSQTLQRISRRGGKVQSVTIQSPSYGEVSSGGASPELGVVDVPPAKPVSSPTETESVESTLEVATVEHQQTTTPENQPIPVPEIDSDEYAANIGGDGESVQLIPGLGIKLPKIIKSKKDTKKTAGKREKKSKQKRKN
ncbi:MAG: phycobilisome linker polypeptide [Calothrix sp. MO_167.B12]|nr:phycobilisome linker polypeptide [Calothrix sp. MO_167.B12]